MVIGQRNRSFLIFSYLFLLLLKNVYIYFPCNFSYLQTDILFHFVDAMNSKSKQLLQRYLSKLDRGDPGVPEDADIDPRYSFLKILLS